MTTFPFTAYRVEISGGLSQKATPAPRLACESCGNYCGHTGSTRIEEKYVEYYIVREYLVIGENEAEWFVEIPYIFETEYGHGEGRTSIEVVDKSDTYLDEQTAEAEAKRRSEELI